VVAGKTSYEAITSICGHSVARIFKSNFGQSGPIRKPSSFRGSDPNNQSLVLLGSGGDALRAGITSILDELAVRQVFSGTQIVASFKQLIAESLASDYVPVY